MFVCVCIHRGACISGCECVFCARVNECVPLFCGVKKCTDVERCTSVLGLKKLGDRLLCNTLLTGAATVCLCVCVCVQPAMCCAKTLLTHREVNECVCVCVCVCGTVCDVDPNISVEGSFLSSVLYIC